MATQSALLPSVDRAGRLFVGSHDWSDSELERKGFEQPPNTPEQFYEESFKWSQSIKDLLEKADSASVYLFVDHEYFGPGVVGAARLRKQLGDPVYFPGMLF